MHPTAVAAADALVPQDPRLAGKGRERRVRGKGMGRRWRWAAAAAGRPPAAARRGHPTRVRGGCGYIDPQWYWIVNLKTDRFRTWQSVCTFIPQGYWIVNLKILDVAMETVFIVFVIIKPLGPDLIGALY